MKALVHHGPGHEAWEEVPEPKLQDPTDAIVEVENAVDHDALTVVLTGLVTTTTSAGCPTRCPAGSTPPLARVRRGIRDASVRGA